MGLETATYVGDFVSSNPTGGSDYVSSGDDHIRLIKSALQNTFPNATRGFYFESVASKTSNYTTTATDQNKLIKMDASSGARTVALLAASTAGAGYILRVEKSDGSGNTVYLDGAGAQTIGGQLTWALEDQHDSVTVMSDGNNWVVIGRNFDTTDLTPDTVTATTVTATNFEGGTFDGTNVTANVGTITSLAATTFSAGSATFTGAVSMNSLTLSALNGTTIGATSPSTGRFTTLTVLSTASFSSTITCGALAASSVNTSGGTIAGGLLSGTSLSISGTASFHSALNASTLTTSGSAAVGGSTAPADGLTVHGDSNSVHLQGVTSTATGGIQWWNGSGSALGSFGVSGGSGSMIASVDPDALYSTPEYIVKVHGVNYQKASGSYMKHGDFTTDNPINGNTAEAGVWINAGGFTNQSQLDVAGEGVAARFNRSGASNGEVILFKRNGSTQGNVSVTASGATFNSTSDRRLKENIQPLAGAEALLNLLKPYSFNFKAVPGEMQYGFIADEFMQVLPYAVTGSPNAVDENGDPAYQTMDASKAIPLLVAALQEALKRIKDLEDRQ